MPPNVAEARAILAEAGEREAHNDGPAAIAAYERALALGLPPDERYRALVGLGGALRAAGRNPEAVQVLRVAISEFPEMAAPHTHLALALYGNGDARKAMVALMDLVLRYAPLAEQEPALIEERDRLARDPTPSQDWRALATQLSRKEFVETFPVPFLFEISGRMRHAHVAETPDEDTQVSGKVKVDTVDGRAPVIPSQESFVMPLRKVATAVPSAITFGRGSANDVIIPDSFVSKVHAFLRRGSKGWELSDAGSRNGVWIGGKRLDSKGTPMPISSGDVLTFGRVVFFFLDAAALWDRMHQRGAKVRAH
jgi:pSer/pThr/pTyr-binding forkhead associated (FHA) protein